MTVRKRLLTNIIAKKKKTHKIKKNSAAEFFKVIDKSYQANLAKITAGISPAGIATAYYSWLMQLSQCPGRVLELTTYPLRHAHDTLHKMWTHPHPADGKDVRFQTENWDHLPWRVGVETFLQMEKWWKLATVNIPGVPARDERTVSFITRQMLDALSPSNFVFSNPDLFLETFRSGGENILRGASLGVEDFLEKLAGTPPSGIECFTPGKEVAITPGRVVYRNHLIELLQFDPQTDKVFREPILILPAWIMKYYILDLSPHNSLVKWLVNQGHTVFIVSWRNPTSEDRNLGIDDYYRLGAMSALDVISNLIPDSKIHLMGYCLGGTLAMITAAAMARNHDERLCSLILLAAQGDFSEAGELMLFVTESEITFLENMMWDQGYLDTKQMAGSFQMLRSYDLIWSKMIQDYLHGTERGMIDLLAWNADTTRMPYKMHSEYLEKLFLNNDFSSGRFTIEGEHVVAENINLPTFVVSTEKDHVAPWYSVYKIHFMVNGDITFVLANGGHNAGIVSEPGHLGRHYRIRQHRKGGSYLGPEHWYQLADVHDGSWWNELHHWLVLHSSKKKVTPPSIDKNLPLAPGKYVLQK